MGNYVYYGKEKMYLDLPAGWNLVTQGEPTENKGLADLEKEIIRALDNPIGVPPIEEMAKPGKAVILFDDLTRPTPAQMVFPEILKRLNTAGVKDGDITAICALGSHPNPTDEQILEKIGREAYERLSPRVIIHDSNSKENIIIGRTTYVCEDLSKSEVEGMRMSYDKTIGDALARIQDELPEADVTIFPAGSITVPVMGS